MSAKLSQIKSEIISSSIAQDQQRVANQWLQTFKHNKINDHAVMMAKMLLACVAQGDFSVSSQLVSDTTLQAPLAHLTAVDYISHASRIIIDYDALSLEEKAEFLEFFPEPSKDNGIFSRSATHAVIRKEDGIKELKGFMLGVQGQLPSLIKTPCDFGVNIAMGGDGQTNFVGNKISKNGYSGHMYYHHQGDSHILMAGLEQSAPSASILEAIWGDADHEDIDVQKSQDQYGQGHSLVGASDTFTAAGSLYFSDPLYQAKLLAETGTMPPSKYGAMQVKLDSENWPEVKKFLMLLTQNLNTDKDKEILAQLLQKPQTAVEVDHKIESYIALDFKTYLKRIESLLDGSEVDLQTYQGKAAELLTLIEKMQSGDSTVLEAFNDAIQSLVKDDSLPLTYRSAIARIKVLFDKQIDIDPDLEATHNQIIFQNKAEELTTEIGRLESLITQLLIFYESENIAPSDQIVSFNKKLNEALELFAKMKKDLSFQHEVTVIHEQDLEKSFVEESSLESSWLKLGDTLELSDLDKFQDQLLEINAFLSKPPVLFAEAAFNKLKDLNQAIQKELQVAQDELEQTEERHQEIVKQMKHLGETHEAQTKDLADKVLEVEQLTTTVQETRLENTSLEKRTQELLLLVQEKEKLILEKLAKVETLGEEISEAHLQNEQLKSDITTLEENREIQASTIRGQEETLLHLRQEITRISNDLAAIVREKEQLVRQKAELDKAIDSEMEKARDDASEHAHRYKLLEDKLLNQQESQAKQHFFCKF